MGGIPHQAGFRGDRPARDCSRTREPCGTVDRKSAALTATGSDSWHVQLIVARMNCKRGMRDIDDRPVSPSKRTMTFR
jgi:hypothetical protein